MLDFFNFALLYFGLRFNYLLLSLFRLFLLLNYHSADIFSLCSSTSSAPFPPSSKLRLTPLFWLLHLFWFFFIRLLFNYLLFFIWEEWYLNGLVKLRFFRLPSWRYIHSSSSSSSKLWFASTLMNLLIVCLIIYNLFCSLHFLIFLVLLLNFLSLFFWLHSWHYIHGSTSSKLWFASALMNLLIVCLIIYNLICSLHFLIFLVLLLNFHSLFFLMLCNHFWLLGFLKGRFTCWVWNWVLLFSLRLLIFISVSTWSCSSDSNFLPH